MVLVYQGVKNGWLTPIETDLITNNAFMNILNTLDVDFFDCRLELDIYKKTEQVEVKQDYSSAESSSTETKPDSQEKKDEEQKIALLHQFRIYCDKNQQLTTYK